MPVDACRLIRKMRGGAQAHLIEAANGKWYVVKFLNNPQHRRVLVNEWLAATFLRYLGLSTPEPAIIRIGPEFLRDNPDCYIQLGTSRETVQAGWHYGSEFPGDPARLMIYDFLPDALLLKVENLREFVGMLAFDLWVGNADSRQAIFFRAKLKEHLSASEAHPLRVGFVTLMIDHGYAFEGHHWRLNESPLQGLYYRPLVYEKVLGLEDFQPWLDRIIHFPETVVDQALKQIPPAWIEGDTKELENLLSQLMRRRKRVPDLIDACRHGRNSPFPAWR